MHAGAGCNIFQLLNDYAPAFSPHLLQSLTQNESGTLQGYRSHLPLVDQLRVPSLVLLLWCKCLRVTQHFVYFAAQGNGSSQTSC